LNEDCLKKPFNRLNTPEKVGQYFFLRKIMPFFKRRLKFFEKEENDLQRGKFYSKFYPWKSLELLFEKSHDTLKLGG